MQMIKSKKGYKVRLIALFMSVLFIFPAMATKTSASTISEIEAKQEELKKETDALESKLDSLRDDEAKAQEYSDALQEKISLTEEKIDTARNNIKDLNASITDLEAKLKESEAQYTETMNLLKERIKALYQAGDIGTIEILLNSTSLYDFSMKTEMLKSVTEHDKKLCDSITAYMVKTEADRNDLKKQKQEVADLKKQLEADQADLVSLQEENDAVIADLQEKQASTQSSLDEKAEEDSALQAELENLIAEQKKKEEAAKKAAEEAAKQQTSTSNGSGDGNMVYVPPTNGDDAGGSDFGWPLPGYGTSYITCLFGNGHYGLDIGAPYGTPIVAAESGTVLNATYHDSWGNNVLIYHNGTYSTRYAHMSSMAVSVGDTVTKGQVIGYVGSTGYSFGNHLHFEVYQNGTRVDPYPFL